MRLDSYTGKEQTFSVMSTRRHTNFKTPLFDQVVAKEAVLHESGALVFRTDGNLVRAFGPRAWLSLEETEGE